MLITVPGEKELYNYDGRYGPCSSDPTDFVRIQNPYLGTISWWSSIYEKYGHFNYIELYYWPDCIYEKAVESEFIERTENAKQGVKYVIAVGIRPLIRNLNKRLYKKNTIIKKYFKGKNRDYTWHEIEYGEYPSNVVDSTIATELEYHYFNKKLTKTGKEYTYLILNKEKKLEEYIFKGKKICSYDI